MSAYNKFNQFVQDLTNGKHDFTNHVFKVMLTDVAPVATNAVLADLTEIAAGNGYTAGGTAASFVSNAQSSGTDKVVLGQVTFTASGGAIAQFRYAVLYNSSQTTPLKPLVGWWDYGAEVNVTNGNSFLVALDQTNGIFTLA